MPDLPHYVIDAQVLQGESRGRGMGRYSAGLTEAIIRSGRVRPTVLLNTALPDGFDQARQWASGLVESKHIKVFKGLSQIMGLIPDNVVRQAHAAAIYDGFISSLGSDVVHINAPFDGMGDETVIGDLRKTRLAGGLRVATLYDLIPFQEPDLHLPDPRYFSWYHQRLDILRSFDVFFAISDYTRDVAVNQFGFSAEKTVAISTDASAHFRVLSLTEKEKASVLKKYGVTRSFIAHTGILEDRKNVKLLVDAFGALPESVRKEYQLVLVAKATPAQISNLRNHAAKAGLRQDDLVFAGFVPDDDLVKLYNLARALVMPSFSEGFGLPLLEAMRCGCPVLGADASSIPEVVGDSRYLFNPHDAQTLAEALKPLLTDDVAYATARAYSADRQALFSWDRSAKRLLDAVADRRPTKPTTDSPAGYYVVKGQAPRVAEPISSLLVSPSGPAAFPLFEGTEAVSEAQEIVISNQPFAMLWPENTAHVSCSADLRYQCTGYASLYRDRFSRQNKVSCAELARHPNALAVVSDTGTQAVQAQLKEGLRKVQPISDFIAGISGQATASSAVELAALAYINLMPARQGSTLFVDVTELAQRDSGTGIQRVVRSILFYFLTVAHETRVEAIYRDGDQYRYARKFCAKFLGLAPLNANDDYVYFSPGDTFLGLDLDALISKSAMERLASERMRGVKLIWVVYDMLPVKRPEWFHIGLAGAVQDWIGRIVVEADQIVCISQSVADDVSAFLDAAPPVRTRPIDISWWHLGSDLGAVRARREPDRGHEDLFEAFPKDPPLFLTVGTIEPRKGIEKLLNNAEALWADGQNICFVLVGRRGWNVDALIRRLERHPELGRRLFWLEGASDDILEALYDRATAALLPSEGEGFGLPLVEAARHNTPIIARDLPVFREVGRDGAFYFGETTALEMADRIKVWLTLYAAKKHPLPNTTVVQTWGESAETFFNVCTGAAPYLTWQPR